MVSVRGRKKIFVAVEIWEFEYLLAELLLRGLLKPKDSKPGEEKIRGLGKYLENLVNQSSFCRGVVLEFGSGSS